MYLQWLSLDEPILSNGKDGFFIKGQSQGKYSKYGFLLDDDIAIMQGKHGGIMHNKIGIINGKALFYWFLQLEQVG